MINALFSSRDGGTRKFQTSDGIRFGWQAIVDMYGRECLRRDGGHARMVPKLREIHIIRDSWTKLNVTPAKIMQVSHYNMIDCCTIWCIVVARIGAVGIVRLY